LSGEPAVREKNREQLLAKVFDRAQAGLRDEVGSEEYERRRHDFVFHMLDWGSDLSEISALIDDPETMSVKEATTLIIGFLYHVVPHLNAAGRLLLDEIPDAFVHQDRRST
jgi:hypothetical protein